MEKQWLDKTIWIQSLDDVVQFIYPKKEASISQISQSLAPKIMITKMMLLLLLLLPHFLMITMLRPTVYMHYYNKDHVKYYLLQKWAHIDLQP